MSASEDAWRCAARAAARCEVMMKFRVLCCGFDVVVVEKSFIYMCLIHDRARKALKFMGSDAGSGR